MKVNEVAGTNASRRREMTNAGNRFPGDRKVGGRFVPDSPGVLRDVLKGFSRSFSRTR